MLANIEFPLHSSALRSMRNEPERDQALFEGYKPHSSAWDEMFQASGNPHPHCLALFERLGRLPKGDFQDRLPRGAYFPFSAGDRHCIGEGFAWQEALLILATLVERWRFELVPGQHIRPRPSVTLRPDGPIKMIVRPR